MTTDWIGIRQYQETYQDLHKEADDSTETLTDHLDPSCTICNVIDTARTVPFDNFWNLVTTHFAAKSWTNNTVVEFEYLRSVIRTYKITEEEEEKVEAEQTAFQIVLRLLQTIRYKQYPNNNLKDTEYLIVNTGVHTKGYTNTQQIETKYQNCRLKLARDK